MKKILSALLVVGLVAISTPASEAAGKATPLKLIKLAKKPVKKVSSRSAKAITVAYVTTDTNTAVTPVDTSTAVAPVDTRTAVTPAPTPTPAPIVNPVATPAPVAATLTGEQLMKIFELFAKLTANSSVNANTTTNNVLTPITVAPQVITQTIVSPTVNAPVAVNQLPAALAPLTPITQTSTLTQSRDHDDDDHSSERHK
jgi:hypothetical protein